MAKPEQRNVARTLFIEQGKNRSEIAELLSVREKTVGDWAKAGNWEALRNERLLSSESVITTLKQLVSELASKRMAMERDPGCSAEDKRGATDELSKASKALSEAKGEGEVTLGARLKVMSWVFEEMRRTHRLHHDQLIDFQEKLLEEAARLHA